MSYTLFRPTYTDKKTRQQRRSDTYHIRFRDHLNRRQTLSGLRRESATHALALKLKDLVDCRRDGRMPSEELRKWIASLPEGQRKRLEDMDLVERRALSIDKPLIQQLEGIADAEGKILEPGWKQWLKAKGTTDGHVNTVVRRVKTALNECNFFQWRDISRNDAEVKLVVWLGGRRERKEITGTEYNYVIRDLQSFCRWMHEFAGAPDVALSKVSRVNNADMDALKRRALSAEEMRRLLRAAVNGPVIQSMTGDERALLYRFGFETGMRPGQVRALKVSDFKLDAEPPTVTTLAKYVKRRTPHLQTLRAEMATILAKSFKGKLPAASAFKMPGKSHMADMLRADLARARAAWIAEAKTDDERQKRLRSDFLAAESHAGERAVFYSLRHAHGTALAESGVAESVIAKSMHHASRKTTARYIHASDDALADAISNLPSMPAIQKQRATGTYGAEPDGCLRKACATGQTDMDSGGQNEAERTLDFGAKTLESPENRPGLVAELADATDSKSVTPRV